jgi:DnaJ-class molecular chaperone
VDFYRLLGVSLAASDAEIKHAFREAAKVYHPDINKEPDAEETFRTLYIAYDTLTDPFKRRMYDRLMSEDYAPATQTSTNAYYEKMQRRSEMRARSYAAMDYDEFEETAFTKASFHAKQVAAFIIFFAMLCAGMIGFIVGAHYVFFEKFNGAQVTGYGFWAGAAVLSYISCKALLGVYEIWRS